MLELNKEYVYKEICELLGWQVSTGKQKQRQIKCIEESYEFYHPMNKKTHKEKKSYIFTKMIREPILKDGRKNNGKEYEFPEEEFDYIWREFVAKENDKNVYHYRCYVNEIFFTSSKLFKEFGFDYGAIINGIKYDDNDEVVIKLFQNIIYDAVKDNTIGRLCKRYGFKKNSLPKGILCNRGKRDKSIISDNTLLPMYEVYLEEELKSAGLKSLFEAIVQNKYLDIVDNIRKRFADNDKKYNVQRLNMIKVDDIALSEIGNHCEDKKLLERYRQHFKEIVLASVERSCLNRIEDKKEYKKKLTDNQKKLLQNYLYQLLKKPIVLDKPIVDDVIDELPDWLNQIAI